MKIGILGTGIGSEHIKLYQHFKQVEEIIIFGRNDEKLKKIKEAYNVETTTDIEKILQDDAIDLIDICLPTDLHMTYIIKALKHGKHVFCETPASYSIDELEEIKQVQAKYQKNIFVNLFIKFSKAHQILHDTITSKRLGNLQTLHIARKTPAIFGNLDLNHITTNLMLHEVDFITWCFGLPEEMITDGFSCKENTAYVFSKLKYPHFNVYLEGNTMMPDYHPFEVNFEAIFDHGVLQFLDQETINGEQISLIEYTNDHKKQIDLQDDDSFLKVFDYVLSHLTDQNNHLLSIDAALETLRVTLDLKQQLK